MFPLFMSGTRKKIWRASLRLRLITLGLAPLLVAFPIIALFIAASHDISIASR